MWRCSSIAPTASLASTASPRSGILLIPLRVAPIKPVDLSIFLVFFASSSKLPLRPFKEDSCSPNKPLIEINIAASFGRRAVCCLLASRIFLLSSKAFELDFDLDWRVDNSLADSLEMPVWWSLNLEAIEVKELRDLLEEE